MFDIEGNVLVVRMGAGKSWIVRMGLCIVPGYFVSLVP